MSEASLLELLDVISDGELHSGEALAQRFGISRAALAKRMTHLRDWGLDLSAQSGAGYRLASPVERLDATRISKLLSGAARGTRITVVSEIDSTNSALLAADAAADPQLLFAERQTAGRGRRGRSWVSPFAANLYASMAYSFASWPPRITTLPLAIAVAVARVIEAAGLPEVGIKWPNDLQVDGAKLAGILIEPRGEAGGPCRVVVGVGINVAMSAAQAQQVDQSWCSLSVALAAKGRPVPGRNALAAQLASELSSALGHFAEHGFAPFAAEWNRRDVLAQQNVRVDAAQAISGTAQGIDADGGLIIATAAGREVVHAGDVSVRRA